jgi:hypothetical protein
MFFIAFFQGLVSISKQSKGFTFGSAWIDRGLCNSRTHRGQDPESWSSALKYLESSLQKARERHEGYENLLQRYAARRSGQDDESQEESLSKPWQKDQLVTRTLGTVGEQFFLLLGSAKCSFIPSGICLQLGAAVRLPRSLLWPVRS